MDQAAEGHGSNFLGAGATNPSARNVAGKPRSQTMKPILEPIFAALILMLCMAVPAAAGPLEDAAAADEKGDYATAQRLLRPLADQGNASAQYNLGIMHYTGQGIPQNAAEAAKWFRKAAEQGDEAAQY